RGVEKLPRGWIQIMKNSMRTLGPKFTSHRMVSEYAQKFYFNSFEKRADLMKNECTKVREFSSWKSKVQNNWSNVKFISITEDDKSKELKVGEKYSIHAEIELGELSPDDVDVQIYFGKVDNGSEQPHNYVQMSNQPKKRTGSYYIYKGEISCSDTGQFGFTLRILPKHSLLINQFELGLIRWA
ncbi:MAG: alpha-glucan phosphorylase, partial [Ignavibacteria bacterium]|nr:alpha-glucan phosphorylase [Ignavibacteria bacterium]